MDDMLSAFDSFFIHLESPRTPMHMGSIGIFEGEPLRAADGRIRIDEVRAVIEQRLDRVPKLRRRPGPAPMFVLPRSWEDDPAFDITRHVRQAALPGPGSEEQLLDLCAEILSWPLDRSHPLWEMWFVEGLEGGRVAVLEKLHHAVADGLASVELAAVLLDMTRHVPAPPTRAQWQPRRASGTGRRAAHDLACMAARTRRGATTLAGGLRHPRRALGRAAEAADGMRSLFAPSPLAPGSSINMPIGPHRRIAVVRQSLAQLHIVERGAGVTLNDVLLTAVGGGIRMLLEARAEPLHELQVLVPVGLAHAGDGSLGNKVSAMVVRVPLDEPDPGAALRRTAAAVRDCKRHHQAQGAAALLSALDLLPQPGIAAVAQVVQHQPFVNLVVTNVPGPKGSLYAMGARMLEAIPIVPIAGNLSIGIAAFSYHGRLGIGIFADRDRCPDVALVARGMERTFSALVRRARRGSPGAPMRPGPLPARLPAGAAHATGATG